MIRYKYTVLMMIIAVLGVNFTQAVIGAPAPRGIEDLKALQNRVQQVVEKNQKATVALNSNENGAWGSGVVVSADGRILTAAHVVQGAEYVSVIFPDGSETKAKVLGANRSKDTAMLQIVRGGEYPYVEIGNSDSLEVGDLLVAMGHAGGYDPLRRPPVRFGRLISQNVADFFTSDCTLIGGDSGGPIFDISGKLVGINSSIGFDLKANNHAGISGIKADWDKLAASETWGSLSANPFANNDSPVLGVVIAGSNAQGVVLSAVVPGSPAEHAGVQRGDVIRSVAGIRVRDGGELLVEINRFRAGQELEIEVVRGRRVIPMSIMLTRRGELYKQ
ncbi:S1C family serine protease [Rubritalea marina]|uniref:S1C family serine protease n=1 Tax=Rubritalea marina TaxID=361055 RepID=UPI0009FC6BC8|nr:trypsin-like peptidase domain-containing protein [Rubritalea marina]